MEKPHPEPLADRAEKLAREMRWSELAELLGGAPREELLARPDLAYRLGEALYHLGRMQELAAFSAELEAAMREARHVHGTMRALNLAGIAAFELGRTVEARDRFEALMELAADEEDEDMLARAANNLGALANLEGRPDEALSLYNMALPLYQKLGRRRGIAQTHQNLGMSFRDLGLLREADAAYRRTAELGRELGYDHAVAMATVGRGEIEVLRGDAELGRTLADRGLQLAREIGDPITEGTALRVRALAEARRAHGRSRAATASGAEADLAAALELARATGHALLWAECERDLGRLLVDRGRSEEALVLLRAARARFDDIGARLAARALESEIQDLAPGT